ncbi:hypothetical protein QKW60_10685 [Defluviimonas aestuarii]|uniref:hypothetical protein n=1 Tax=Albidovulum aestuarii TaxID=1130726 RepID=UPI00249AE956|nr:hypothetical protein [Defluviimonas aestuarii]MDI3336876.1 hypothetical protein [Defluviimonas aestuarii]
MSQVRKPRIPSDAALITDVACGLSAELRRRSDLGSPAGRSIVVVGPKVTFEQKLGAAAQLHQSSHLSSAQQFRIL